MDSLAIAHKTGSNLGVMAELQVDIMVSYAAEFECQKPNFLSSFYSYMVLVEHKPVWE